MSDFNGKIMQQAWMLAPEVKKIMEILNSGKAEARFIGGCVRDALVNREIIDIDIATTLKPKEVISLLKKNEIKYAPTGLKHGTITAIVEGRPFEITTLRLDIKTFGRHAEVEFTDDWQKDAARRDFTINAMSANIEGDLFDPFGGVADLRLGKVRFIGDASQRIEEDVLRILRFFRFYAHFGRGEADECSLSACIAAADKIKNLSFERIRSEVLKILEADNSPAVWKIMVEGKVVDEFLPEACEFKNLEKLVKIELKYDSQMFPLRRFTSLLNIPPEDIKAMSGKMRFSNNQYKDIFNMIKAKDKVSMAMSLADVQKLVYIKGNDLVRNLLLLDAAKTGLNDSFEELYHEATVFRSPRFPVIGKDLLKLGCEEGVALGNILNKLEQWWLENNFKPNRKACLKKLEEIFEQISKK